MNKKKLVMLAGKGLSTNILYNSLKEEFEILSILLEDPVPIIQFIKKRIKKIGLGKVAGQIIFQLSIAKYLQWSSSRRKKEILKDFGLDDSPLPEQKIIHLKSINDSETILILQKLRPDLAIVNGTRIISEDVLNSIPVKFLNIHAGITPKYRNVHGAYWAIVNNDLGNCGVTVHLVDKGIDTGKIIYQRKIEINRKDNFATYPLLQLAEGIIYLKKAIRDIFDNKTIYLTNNLESKIWHHPTFWQYLYNRIVHNKK
ncbi:MAG: formyl transferase [Ginsengibacter sp.]